jgi:hypothetical protein
MATKETSQLHLQHAADEATLAKLGYKQEFRRAFTPLEVGSTPALLTFILQ